MAEIVDKWGYISVVTEELAAVLVLQGWKYKRKGPESVKNICFRLNKKIKAPKIKEKQKEPEGITFHSFDHILVIRSINGLGDVLMLTPTLREMKKNFPQCRITVATQHRYAPIFENNPDVEWISSDIPIEKIDSDGRCIYNREVNLNHYVENRECQEITNNGVSKINRIDLTAEAFGITLSDHSLVYQVTEEEKEWALKKLKSLKIKKNQKIAGVQIKSVSPVRTYSKIKEVCQFLAEKGIAILLFNEDKNIGWTGKNIHNFCGISLRQVGSLIDQTHLVIGPDSGLIHFASALKKPTIGFFNEVDPDLRIRYYKDAFAFFPRESCHKMPCGFGLGCKKECFDSIMPQMVVDKAMEMLMVGNRDQSLVSEDRHRRLEKVASKIISYKLKGSIAEVGVYKGGTALTLAKVFSKTKKKLYLFDTFEGIPYADSEVDVHKQGDYGDVSFKSIEDMFSGYNNEIRKGIFPATAKGLEKKKFCFVHIDTDVYQSVKDCIEFFYPRVVDGGYLIFDDWEWKYCPGVKKGVEEFLIGKIEKPSFFNMQCVIQKGREVAEIPE
jgi:O-methyltransferase